MPLLPLPLTANAILKYRDRLRDRLKNETLDEISENQLNKLFNWANEKNLVNHRIHKNLTIVYSKKELRDHIKNTLIFILGTKKDITNAKW